MAKLTAAEMQREAKLIYESIVSGDAPGYTPREWSELLTQAQEFVIQEIIEKGFDRNEKNRKSIDRLIKSATITGGSISAGHLDNSFTINLETDYYHIINKYVDVQDSVPATFEKIKTVPISHQAYKSNINNPFRKPFVDNNNNDGLIWELVYNDSSNRQILVIVPNGYTVTNVYLDYLKDPEPIVVPYNYTSGTIEGLDLTTVTTGQNCELSSIVQRDIVKKAANLAAAYTRDRLGYQMQKIEEGEQPPRK